MSAAEERSGAPQTEEVKPYKIQISPRYLDLTRRKLELTRLPHENAEPKSRDWWEPKPTVEPLIDYWLEQYSWREQEGFLNARLPQFRTTILMPKKDNQVRIHFIHARSPHANAIPLLLIPPFPFTNLSLGHLVPLLTDPDNPKDNQPFHLVIPSLPGLGFSDALPNNTPCISTTAEMFNILMGRLDYELYLVTNAGAGATSPAEIDWKLINCLSTQYTKTCLGAHFISPLFRPPSWKKTPMAWAKWRVASQLQRPMLGYEADDFAALKRSQEAGKPKRRFWFPSRGAKEETAIFEPNTMAYALCDSPTGLLLLMLMFLKLLGAGKDFANSEIITMTQLAWLPGPEAALRFWAYCMGHHEKEPPAPTEKPKVGVTLFLGSEPAKDEEEAVGSRQHPLATVGKYTCPSWAKLRYDVLSVTRLEGDAGLLAWEQPDVIAKGARRIADEVTKLDKRLRPSAPPGGALLQQVVVDNGDTARAEMSGTTVQASEGSSPLKLPTPDGSGSLKVQTPTELIVSPSDEQGRLAPPSREARPKTPPIQPPPDGDPARKVDREDSSDGSPDTIIAIRT